MADLLVNFTEPTHSPTGDLYYARALGRVADDGLWEGWLEFTLAGADVVVTTARETEQPNRADLMYWAEGLSAVYLEGALARALRPVPVHVETTPRRTGAARRAPASGSADATRDAEGAA